MHNAKVVFILVVNMVNKVNDEIKKLQQQTKDKT